MNHEFLYGPCPCGSGKKFKFCCYAKYRDEFESDMSQAEMVAVVRDHAAGICDLERENPEATELFDRGYEALKNLEFERARRLLKEARTLHPKLFTAWNDEASAAWNQGDFKAAYEIQKEGNACAPILNVWGIASQALYARALEKDEEARELLEKAVRETPLNLFVAERVCTVLALDRRHRDMLDYISRSQLEDDPRIRFYAAVAHCNLGETGQALPLMRAAMESPHAKLAKFYVGCLEDDGFPRSVYEDDWPYFDWPSFLPARLLDEAIEKKKKAPLSVCGGLAVEALEVLVSDNVKTAKELIPLAEGHGDDPRWAKLLAGLQWIADDDEKVERGELPPVDSATPVGVTSVPDTDAYFPGCVKWRLAYEFEEGSSPEADADRVLNGLVRPYAERYWRGVSADCEFVLLTSLPGPSGKLPLESPIAKAGRIKCLWRVYRQALVDYFESVCLGVAHLTVSHDMMYGGPILKIETADDDDIAVFCIALPDRAKE